ncbi:MAG: LLM class flavin-dependent oxidoreductase [Thermoleophilia bacterium]
MTAPPLPLSVLDLSPVPSGATSAQALRNTLDLAVAAEGWGYARYWLAEHHNTPGLASSAPEVMIGQVLAATSRIRVGSGGVMLPNHAPLRVAETFRVLEALYPGRIDLGIGRAPGTDGVTAAALRRTPAGIAAEDFPAQMGELLAYAGDGFPQGHPLRSVSAQPADVPMPPVWMLGSSEYGARAAAMLGVGLAFARYLNPRNAAEIMRAYRDEFRPSPELAQPRAILAVSVICAETTARAEHLAASGALSLIRMRTGRPAPLPTPEEALAHPYSEGEADQVRRYMRAQVLGDPETVAARLRELAADCRADELMLMTTVHDHDERRASYRRVAEALGPAPAAARAGLSRG